MEEQPIVVHHDGTSQKGRKQKALDPAYVSVDERSTLDLLEYIRGYAKKLMFFHEQGGEPGDWSKFLGDLKPGDIAAYLADPACFDHDPSRKAKLGRPHRVLFFTFLELLKTVRDQMNGLTKRHLDFFYKEALKLSEKEGVPDKVYVLAEAADREDQVLLPKGTGFHAGEDALGRPVVYRSDEDLMVNRAVLGDVKSLFAQRKIVDLDAVRRNPGLLGDNVQGGKQSEQSFFAMLRLALGEPVGGELEPYPGNREVTPELLGELDRFLAFIRNDLSMSLSSFRKPVELKHTQDNETVGNGEREMDKIPWPKKILGGKADDFEGCCQCLGDLERYFHMTAEQFEWIREKSKDTKTTKTWEWRKVYDILKAAHSAKLLPFHRDVLKNRRMRDGFEAMIRYALGDPEPGDPLPDNKDFDELKEDKYRDYLIQQLFIDPLSYAYIRDVKDVKGDQASDDQRWSKVYDILESARRRKRNWRPAEFEVWENIYAAADAARVKPGKDTQDDVTRWRTFGAPGAAPFSVPGAIGFALSSPMLALSEGNRIITLTLGFTKASWAGLGDMNEVIGTAFRIALSTGKGLLIKEKFQKSDIVLNDTGFQIRIALGEKDPPIVPPEDPAVISSPYPFLHILLADLEVTSDNPPKKTTKQYGRLKSLILENIRIEVETDGLSALSMQNDQGLVDPRKPFEPFGSFPVAGSGFYFSHPELCVKKLDRLDFHFEWLGAPTSFKDHYSGYDASVAGEGENSVFRATLKLFDRGSLVNFVDNTANALALFDKADATKPNRQTRDGFTTKYPSYTRERDLRTGHEVLDWNRYFKLELCAPDFQHSVYPKVAAENALRKKADGTPGPVIVHPPYTPKLKKMVLGYKASRVLDLTKSGNAKALDRLYYIEPFGCRDITGCSVSPPFLPRFENEGELFIGLRNVRPPQTLSLLFQMDEGSADPDLARMPVRWDYLDGDTWKTLEEGHLIADTTRGLLNTGLIRLNLPQAQTGRLLPSDQYWLRVSIERNARSVADIIGIHTQAVLATFENRANDPARLDRPLAPFSVTGLAERNPKIKAVSQPYSSFGGKSPEEPGRFNTRVSERLRHKNRALTAWDYEHLVLEAFPEIYKVKCLPVGTSEDPDLSDAVQVIVIPDIRGKRHLDRFEPKLPADVLIRIEDYLRGLSSPSARVTAKNPSYVELTVRLGVYLRDKGDKGSPGFYKKQLNRALQRFLSPWAFNSGADIVLGGQTHSSLIVNHLENLPYVDYVAHIELITDVDGEHEVIESGMVKIMVPNDTVLVSAKEHRIDLIDEEGYVPELFTGINFMEIGLDFRIDPETSA